MTVAARRTSWLAFACFAAWLVAAASATRLGIWLAIGSVAVALGAVVLLVDGPGARALLQPSPRRLLLGAAAGAVMAAATYLLYPVLSRALPIVSSDAALLYSAFRAPSRVVASIALVPVIVGEELVWRGAVQTALVLRFGPWLGTGLAATSYAAAHAPLGSPVLLAVALLCGVGWGALRATSGSLVPAVIAHIGWDVLVLLWLPLDSI